MAHEIRSPLSTIRLTMEVMAEDLQDPQTPKERRDRDMINTVIRQCHRLETMLAQFMKYAKATEIEPVPMDLNAEVQAVLQFYQEKAKAKNIEIVAYLTPNLPRVLLDGNAFETVLWNLINNADAAMEDGGQLIVRTYLIPGGVALELIDNGCGMDATTLERLYDPYYTTKKHGFGLGLPIVKRIVDSHHATIDVQSALRHGTKFTLRFPVLPQIEGGATL